MELKFNNGERIILGRVQQKVEGEGNYAGRKANVKLSYVGKDENGREIMNDLWVAFWNGSRPDQPQLYSRISEIPVGQWIIVKIAEPVGNRKDVAALEFICGDGWLTAAIGTNNETTVVVGTPNTKGSKRKEINGEPAFNAVVAVADVNGKTIWHQIVYTATKSCNDLCDRAEQIVGKNIPTIFVFGKTSAYEGKDNAFTSKGYLIEPMQIYQPEDVDEVADVPEEPVDVQITIGIHAVDKPMLSMLTSPDDIGWMRSVVKYYKNPSEDEVPQIEAIKMVLSNM